ncbi:MAG: hypothetical protein FWD94_07780, partial [Treponema sp.]|nr:hypothetical protein [Treponema sp.]
GMKFKLSLFLLLFPVLLPAQQLHSPTWGFSLDIPPGYVYTDGNAFDRFSFEGPSESMLDIAVYDGVFADLDQLVAELNLRLGNVGDTSFFEYSGREAAIMELEFGSVEGWALALRLPAKGSGGSSPLLVALAYAPAGTENVDLLHISALNSLAPTYAERRMPGPVMEFAFPRGERVRTPLAGTSGLAALIAANDAEASQALVDQEFQLLTLYQESEFWQEAWIRFYRAIFRDAWDRIADAGFQLERNFRPGGADREAADRAFAQNALSFVQNFTYERDLDGSDFVNPVTAVTEGRGDCDSRAMLWALILAQANIRSGIMVSREYSHAMGLADLPGSGARFDAEGTGWLVAETTAKVDIGLIAQDKSNSDHWLGVVFE